MVAFDEILDPGVSCKMINGCIKVSELGYCCLLLGVKFHSILHIISC